MGTVRTFRRGVLVGLVIDGVQQQVEAKPPPELQPLPRNQWPWWAQWLASHATPEDKGVGDVVARMIGHEKSDAFKAWFKATFGKDCGCNGRQAKWNRQYLLNE